MPATSAPTAPEHLVLPDDSRWDSGRQTFNLLIDQQPEAIAMPADRQEVAEAVAFARERGLRVAPQSTGHNAAPLGSLERTLLLNTSQLDEVAIDAAARKVRVGSGVRWQDVTPALSDLGLAALHGSSPLVGITGYSLGGGIGWLARKYGMQTNAVTAIELVTADGRIVRTDSDNEPELFWALRGGGGNFGVVTAIEFDVQPVRELYAGALFFAIEQAGDVLDSWTELLPELPDELMTWANLLHFPPDPAMPEAIRGQSFTVVMGAFLGSEAEGRDLLQPLRALRPAIDTFAVQAPIGLAELAMDPPEPLPIVTNHALVDELPAPAIEEIASVAGKGSALGMVQLRHMGGALGRRSPGAGARATLPGQISMLGLGVVPEPEAMPQVQRELAALSEAVAPHRVGDYPNFVEAPADAGSFFDNHTWTRLREVKSHYDPDELFRGNHYVPPAEARPAD